MKFFWIAALALLVGACASGRKTYPNDLPDKSLSVRPSLTGVRGALHIHGVDARCKTEYLGTLALDRVSLPVGLTPERTAYLVFEFSGSSMLRGSFSMTAATLLKPRRGHRYEIDASYRNDIYHVVVREVPPKGFARELPLADLSACPLS